MENTIVNQKSVENEKQTCSLFGIDAKEYAKTFIIEYLKFDQYIEKDELKTFKRLVKEATREQLYNARCLYKLENLLSKQASSLPESIEKAFVEEEYKMVKNYLLNAIMRG